MSEGGADWTPPDPENFRVNGMVFAGADPDGPGDSFDFELCTPRWLADHFDDHVPMSGRMLQFITSPHSELPLVHGVGSWWFADNQVLIPRGLILVRRWDPALVERAVREAFGTVTAPTWELAADRVGRLVPWEFAYLHDEAVDHTELDS